MNEMNLIVWTIFAIVLMAKKKEYAWQATLGGQKAVDWLKPGTEVVPTLLEFGLGEKFLEKGYNIQDWNLTKDCLLIHQEGLIPVLVSSPGVLAYYSHVANSWLEAKSTVTSDGGTDAIGRPDTADPVSYKIDKGPGQFDPYFVVVE